MGKLFAPFLSKSPILVNFVMIDSSLLKRINLGIFAMKILSNSNSTVNKLQFDALHILLGQKKIAEKVDFGHFHAFTGIYR